MNMLAITHPNTKQSLSARGTALSLALLLAC
jgi:hypothetical protein